MNEADTMVRAVSTARTQSNRYFAITSKVRHTFCYFLNDIETEWASNQVLLEFSICFRAVI